MSLPLAVRGLEAERGDAFAERGEGELIREPLWAPPDEATLVPPERLAHGALRRSGDVAQPRSHLWGTDAVVQSTDTDADVLCRKRQTVAGRPGLLGRAVAATCGILRLRMCMRTCMCTCMCTCKCACACMCTCECMCTCMCMCVCMCPPAVSRACACVRRSVSSRAR